MDLAAWFRRSLCSAVALLLIAAAPAGAAAGVPWTSTFGFNVDAVNPSTGPEVCTVRENCQGGGFGVQSGVGGTVIPQAVGVAPSGDIYVTEASFRRVQEFTAAGTFVRMWGKDVIAGNGATGFEVCTVADQCKSGTAGTSGGEFDYPAGIAFDAAGNVYVTDLNNSRVQEFTAAGGFIRAWGRDVSTSTAGTGLETCTTASDCQIGLVTSTASGGGQGGFLAYPVGIAVDAAGFVYVANQSGRRIERFAPTAAFDRAWGQGVLSGGTSPEICTVAASCTTGGSVDGKGGNVGLPTGVAVDTDGNVYVYEAIAFRMEKFTTQGTWLRTWGKNVDAVAPGTGFEICTVSANCQRAQTGTQGGEFLNAPAGPVAPAVNAVAVDATGTVYVTDREASRMQAFDTDGAFLRVWGTNVDVTGPGSNYETCFVAAECQIGTEDSLGGGMSRPTGVAATPGGTVYQGDQTGARVQTFAPCTSGTVRLSGTTYAANESTGGVDVTVERTGGDACPATFQLATTDGTATAGADYTATLGTFTVPAGASSQVFRIPLVDDAVTEPTETFGLALSNATRGTALGTPTGATVTITDDDTVDTLRFSAATKTVPEAAGTVALTVDRVGDHRNAVSVQYVTTSGTATSGADFTATPGLLSFANGEASKTIVVPITDDGTPEGDENFTVTLSAPAGNAILGSPKTTTVTITDDDKVDTIITSGPDGFLQDRRFRFFLFEANPVAGSTFTCTFDGTATPCSSPFDPGADVPEGPHTFSVTAKSAAGDIDPTPATRAFFVDTVRPVTTAAPSGTRLPLGAWSGSVIVRAVATDADPGSGVKEVLCSVDPSGPAPQTSAELRGNCPVTVSAPGAHVVYAAAVDKAGNAGIPARVDFTIARPPDTEITSGPSGSTTSRPVTFAFRAIPGGTLECQLDGEPYEACASPLDLNPTLGAHVFRVRAASIDGERDPSPASRSFTLENKTIKGGCSGSYPFGKLIDPDPRRFDLDNLDFGGANCKAIDEECPDGSVCTLTVRTSQTDEDVDTYKDGTGTPWSATANVNIVKTSGRPPGDDSYGSGYCHTRPRTGDARAAPCPAVVTGTALGPRRARGTCQVDRPFFGSGFHKRGDDDARSYFCRATLVIRPVSALQFVGGGIGSGGVFAPAAGKVTLSSTGSATARAARVTKAKPKRSAPALATVTATSPGPGTVNLPLKLSKATKRILRRKRHVTLPILVTFTPTGGKAITSRQRLTLVQPNRGPAKTKRKPTFANTHRRR